MTRPRHALSTRLWHWLNAVCVIVLFMSGLNISNAHPRLYWGEWGFAKEQAWLILPKFPGWMTIPSHYSLSGARDWHVLFALLFAFGLAAWMIAALLNGHFRRDLRLRLAELRPAALAQDIRQHLRLDFSHGGGKFNTLQKLAYAGVVFGALPLMILTGMVMSPGAEALLPFLTDLFGGRQSARSLHFLAAWAIIAFLLLHLALVLLSGPARQLRDMITGGQDDAAA